MSILIFLIIIIIIFVLYYYKNNIEGFINDANFNPMFVMNEIPNEIKLKNPYDSLFTSINIKDDWNVQPNKSNSSINTIDFSQSNFIELSPEEKNELTLSKLTQEQKEYLYSLQIHKTGNLELINGQFYIDKRYPERPIDINFAINPEHYCKLNKLTYPCYQHYGRQNVKI